MNLIVTDYCNRACPYCFAADKVRLRGRRGAARRHISIENVVHYLDFLERSDIRSFKILGGEPSVHPRLPDIVRLGLERNLSIQIFTNGLWAPAILKFFERSETERVNFVINVNEPAAESSREDRLVGRSLRVAGPRAHLGFNIYREEFSLGFAGDLIESHGLNRRIRLGLACPIIGGANAFLPEERFPAIGVRLAAQLRALEMRDILGIFDCGFPLCMFDEAALGTLAIATQGGFASLCGSPIDVGPDLTCWSCFPLASMLNVPLDRFPTLSLLEDFFQEKLAPLRVFGSTPSCTTCKHLHRKQCSGGCTARTIRSVQEHGDPDILRRLGLEP